MEDTPKKNGHLESDLDALLNPKPRPEEEGEAGDAEHKIPIRKITDFSQIPEDKRPTNLEPAVEEEVGPEEKLQSEEKEKYSPPKPLLRYIDQLIKTGAKLEWFRNFTITSAKSVEEAREMIEDKCNGEIITKEQSEKMMGLLESDDSEELVPETEEKHFVKTSDSSELEIISEKVEEADEKPKGVIDYRSTIGGLPEPENNYAYLAGTFKKSPFTPRDFLASIGINEPNESDLGFTTKRLDVSVTEGKLKRNEDGSYVVLDWEEPPKKEELPKQEQGESKESDYKQQAEIEGKEYKFGDSVVVVRTDGQIENDWIFSGIIDGRVLVTKREDENEDRLSKRITPEKFAEWQKTETKSSAEQEEKSEIPPSTVAESEIKHPDESGGELEKVKKPREKSAEEKEEEINAELVSARSKYAEELVSWKKKNHERKSWWRKIQEDLGFTGHEKKMPEIDRSGLLEAEKAYAEAKRKKAMMVMDEGVFAPVLSDEGGEVIDTHKFNEKLLKQAEDEYGSLKEMISEGMPEKDAGRLRKALNTFNKQVPPAVRVTILASLLGVGLGVFAGAGVYGAATYAGYRAAKGFAGLGVSRASGSMAEKYFGNKNEKTREQIFREYASGLTAENFLDRQEKLAQALMEQETAEKRQALKKAGIMAATGGVAAAVLGGVWKPSVSHLSEQDISGIKPKIGHNIDSFLKPPKSPEMIPGTEVDVSSRGFIQTFEDMKSKLLEQYGTADKVPEQYQHFVKTPSVKLAQEFGFYKPNEELESAMGYKGETLELNPEGKLEYHQLGGKTAVFDDTHQFEGKMFDSGEAGTEIPTEAETVNAPEVPAETVQGIDESVVRGPSIPKVQESDISNGINEPEVQGASVIDSGIGHEQSWGDSKLLVLDDKFQDGIKFKGQREVFAMAFERNISADRLGRTVYPIPFEGGKIHIVQGVRGGDPNSVSVLLNGKEIAKGLITDKGPEVGIYRNLKSHWWQTENVYDRAFKQTGNILKTMRKNDVLAIANE